MVKKFLWVDINPIPHHNTKNITLEFKFPKLLSLSRTCLIKIYIYKERDRQIEYPSFI